MIRATLDDVQNMCVRNKLTVLSDSVDIASDAKTLSTTRTVDHNSFKNTAKLLVVSQQSQSAEQALRYSFEVANIHLRNLDVWVDEAGMSRTCLAVANIMAAENLRSWIADEARFCAGEQKLHIGAVQKSEINIAVGRRLIERKVAAHEATCQKITKDCGAWAKDL